MSYHQWKYDDNVLALHLYRCDDDNAITRLRIMQTK